MFLCQLTKKQGILKLNRLAVKRFCNQSGCIEWVGDSAISLLQYHEIQNCLVVLLGSIFNLDELLARYGESLVGESTQKLVRLKNLYGATLPQLLRGDFLLAFVDLESFKLDLIKSPFSVKNFYYFHEGATFVFSNSLGTLKKGLPFECEIDSEKMVDSLAKHYTLSNRTYYKKIFQLESGQVVSWDGSHGIVNRQTYWVAQDHSSQRSLQDYAEGLRYQLEKAVRNHLIEGSVIGCEISGGLDSTSVAAVLANQRSRLLCFSDYSTSQGLANLKKSPMVSNERLLLDFERMYPNSSIDRFDGRTLSKTHSEVTQFCFDHVHGPEHAPNNLLWILSFYERASQQGLNKMFSGAFGDLAFSFRLSASSAGWAELIKAPLRPIKNWVMGSNQDHSFLLRREVQLGLGKNPRLALNSIQDLAQKRSAALNWLRQYISAATNTANAALEYFGVEYCDPTSDLDLVEYCLTIPVEAYQHHGLNRFVTREAMKNLLPESIRLNQVKGVQAPYWFVPLKRELPYYKSLLPKFAKNDLIAKIIDLRKLTQLVVEFEKLPPHKLGFNHQVNMVHALHVGEWVLLHD